ncbi:hypothetical protein CC2G_003322 [Coprinopsis cinerea AmutBmut pab1-1]|nr:hypothetical protein CC2G_003322 [Coprinopsis cinerea AmutBmut pab1-1]
MIGTISKVREPTAPPWCRIWWFYPTVRGQFHKSLWKQLRSLAGLCPGGHKESEGFICHHLGLRCSVLGAATTMDSPDTPDAMHPLSSEELEPGLLYAVLSYRGELASWNWAFFVPNPAQKPIGSSGTIFHVVDSADSIGEWKFEKEQKDVISSPHVVAIIRLADVGFLGSYEDIVGPDSLTPMFKTVVIPVPGTTANAEFSSRVWFLDAIGILHDCGVVQCDDGWLLERELRRCAFTAMDKFLESKGWTAYRAEHCHS